MEEFSYHLSSMKKDKEEEKEQDVSKDDSIDENIQLMIVMKKSKRRLKKN